MGYFKYFKDAWNNPSLKKQRIIKWRKEPVMNKLSNPTKLTKAKKLGYKAKNGFTVVRVRVLKGGRKRPQFRQGRKPKNMGLNKYFPKKNLRFIAEEKVGRKYKNMEVLNSYEVGDDGVHKWIEVILVDPQLKSVKTDKNVGWIAKKGHKRRVYRGLTGAGKKARGLTKKGPNKSRPSVSANKNKGK